MPRLTISLAALAACTLSSEAQELAPYCAELKELNNYAMTRQRFAPITGKPRAGNYRDANLVLTGWTDCAVYGNTTYTCDSAEVKTREEAARAQQRLTKEILACFGGTWAEASEQMGPDFVVLHPKLGSASITLSLDQTDSKTYLVRLVLFLRR